MLLIIAEKPSAAEKIAESLGDAKKISKNDTYYFQVGDTYIVPAVGHLFGLKQAVSGSFYPVFETRWAPTFEISKKNEYSRKYFENMKDIASKATEFIIATDYDTEGSVIGYNILRFLGGKEDAKRMKFSTMTKSALKHAFENPIKMNKELIEAGLTRHLLDWYYGINLSRALTKSVKGVGKVFSIISIGRVQGPMLAFLAEREREIEAFKPVPFWQIMLNFFLDKKEFEGQYKEKQIWDNKTAEKIIKDCKGKQGTIKEISRAQTKKQAPNPYDLTAMQTDAYNLFGYSPKQTADIAQSLYSNAYISYPRTSSQQLPKDLELKDIIEKLKKQVKYTKFCNKILKTDIVPNNGKKKDPAHPAIHPTGEVPKKIRAIERKVYDLIVRRFLACFDEPAERESTSIKIDISGHEFRTSGSKTIYAGWTEVLKPYLKWQEIEFPEGIAKGENVEIKKIDMLEKETSPPSRYSQGSILKELEKKDIGTKATRANILQTLYDRGYVEDKSIKVTRLGMEVINAMEKYSPEVISEELTRKFELEMEKILKSKKKRSDILAEAQEILTKVSEKIRKNEDKIGKILDKAIIETREEQRKLGECPKCGGELKIMFTKNGRFVGCSGYPKCTNAYPIPGQGFLKKTDKVCEKCKTPIIYVFRRGRRPFKMCLDTECETKADWGKPKEKTAKK